MGLVETYLNRHNPYNYEGNYYLSLCGCGAKSGEPPGASSSAKVNMGYVLNT